MRGQEAIGPNQNVGHCTQNSIFFNHEDGKQKMAYVGQGVYLASVLDMVLGNLLSARD